MYYHIIFCRAGPHCGYLIGWFWEDGQDALINVQNRLVVFAGAADARRYAALHGLPVGDDPVAVYDVDAVQHWIDHPLKKRVDPVLLLRIWNLCIDIAAATRRPFERRARRTDRISNKLFWGNNLPAMTPPGEHYIPRWRRAEVQALRQVLRQGVALIHAAFADRYVPETTPGEPRQTA